MQEPEGLPSVGSLPLHFQPEVGPTQNPYPEQQPHPPDSGVVEQSLLVVQGVQGVQVVQVVNKKIMISNMTAICDQQNNYSFSSSFDISILMSSPQ